MTVQQLELHTRSIYVDVELTCWKGVPPPGMKPEIIEIGIVEMDLATLEIPREKSYFVRPRRWEISSLCTNLTGITETDIQSGRPFVEVLTALTEEFAPSQALCCTWGNDAALIADACQTIGLKAPLRNLLDLAYLFQRLFLLKQPTGLSSAIQMLGFDFEGVPHGALMDARNTARLHAAIIRRMRGDPNPPPPSPVEPTRIEVNSVFAKKLRNAFTSVRTTN
jgi:inhibitor of KinA sporulation pathway (predicted exonuclease)